MSVKDIYWLSLLEIGGTGSVQNHFKFHNTSDFVAVAINVLSLRTTTSDTN